MRVNSFSLERGGRFDRGYYVPQLAADLYRYCDGGFQTAQDAFDKADAFFDHMYEWAQERGLIVEEGPDGQA
jgi:hypothetical protein